tara:strand:- start:12 stop:320 length:309 start_codon:yes stop_codon:yes gene_type:complete
MRNKNWVEFNNEPFLNEDSQDKESIKNSSKLNVYTQKNGKRGKTVTIISGLKAESSVEGKKFLKKLKIFCSTGGFYNNEDIQLQGDLVEKVKEFLRKENYQI